MAPAASKSGCLGLPASGSSGVDLPRRKKGKTMDESKCLDKLVKMGFDRGAACAALANNQGDATKAVLALVAAEKAGLKKPAEKSSEKPEATEKSKAKKPKAVKPASSETPDKAHATNATSNEKPEPMEVDEPKVVTSSAVKPASSEKPKAKKSKAEKPPSSEAPEEPPSKRSKKTPEEDDEEALDMVEELSKMLDEVKGNKDKKAKKEKEETKEKKDKKEAKEKKEKKETKQKKEDHSKQETTGKKEQKETKEKKEKAASKEKKEKTETKETTSTASNDASPLETPPPRLREPPASAEKVEKADLRNLNPKSMAKFFNPDTYKAGDAPAPCKARKVMERQATVASIEVEGALVESPERNTETVAASPTATEAATATPPPSTNKASPTAVPTPTEVTTTPSPAEQTEKPARSKTPQARAIKLSPAQLDALKNMASPTDMPRAERKRQFAALGRQLKSQAELHPALVAKYSAADDTTKFDMLREWMTNDGDLGAIYVEEKFTKVVENMNTDQYATVTVFQLEKMFGDSPEALEFIGELIKGQKGTAHPQAPTIAKARMYRVLKCILEEHRKGHKGETSVSVSGEVSDPAAKKSISEKMQSGLKALDNTQFLDRDSGKIVLNKKNSKIPTAKVLTAEEKLVDDFSKLVKKFRGFPAKITERLRDIGGSKHCNELVESLKHFRDQLPSDIKKMEKVFEKSSASNLQVPYDEFCSKATLIEDDLKEALRRKPKKAKTDANASAKKAAKGKAAPS